MTQPYDEFEIISTELTEVKELGVSPLSVSVDFNDLYADHGDAAYEMIARLKDLLA